jgi:hypothetical protein
VTEITSLEQIRQLSREVNAELEAERAAKEAATGGSREVALELLAEELGSREQALEALALQPADHLQRLAPKIAERSEKLAREAEEREAAQHSAEYAASPEGRRAAALEAANKASERKQLAEAARHLAVDEGLATQERTREWSDDEALEYSGLEPSEQVLAREAEERPLSDPAAMAEFDRQQAKERLLGAAYHQMTKEQRIAEASIAGVDPETVAEHHRQDLQRRFS